jgi:hypothetical protein
MLLLLLLLTLKIIAACPTCYGTSVQYAPPFFADELYEPTPATRQVQANMTQRPAYTENFIGNYPQRGAPVSPRTGKQNSVGRQIAKDKHVDLDSVAR